MTVREALQFGRRELSSSRLRYPEEDALLILGLVLKSPRIRLVASSDTRLNGEQESLFRRLIELRASHFPIQYMSGEQEFYGRAFRVRPGVLIPRPETELVVEKALEIAGRFEHRAISVLDVGTGSGCIAVSLALEDPRVQVTAIEPSPIALGIAESNCRRHGCGARVRLICRELRNQLELSPFHLIVSNPPYLDRSSQEIERSVREFEPPGALFGESGRLSVFREIFQAADGLLLEEGRLVLELAPDQLEEVEELGRAGGWSRETVHRDLAGRTRVVVMERQNVTEAI